MICLPMLQAAHAEPVVDRQIIHVLNRLSFGPTLEDFRHVRSIGVDRYIAEQLYPDSIPPLFELRWRIAALDTLRYDAAQLRQLYGPPSPIRGFKGASRVGEGATRASANHSPAGRPSADPEVRS